MKKRLLALVLCLVMVSSLLPITAAAYTAEEVLGWIDGITPNGTYCGDTYFTISVPEGAQLNSVGWRPGSGDHSFGERNYLTKDDSGRYKLVAGLGFCGMEFVIDGQTSMIKLTIYSQHVWSEWTPNGDGTHSRICSNGCVDSPQTEYCADTSPADCKCDDCGASMHTWSYEVSKAGDSLTATCTPNCPIGEVSVKLNAHSVTLPESPFNAKLTFQGDFKEVFHCSDIEYQYEDPTTGWDYVDPNTFTPKPGNYQAGVLVSGLPGNGGAAAMAAGNEDSAGQNASVYLFVKYTAADPTVTAQTGDNRPIELMMGSVVVFSILAAAAFVADSKRRSRQ